MPTRRPEPSERPIALVTGGAKRVGRAICLALAESGCDIHLTYRSSRDDAEDTADALRALGASVSLHALDLDKPEDADAFARRVASELPRLDVLVHNAAIYSPTPLNSVTAEDALRFFRVNALSPLLLTRSLAPALRRSTLGGGAGVVAMLDIHAGGHSLPRTDFAAYALSKAALAEAVRTLARELAPDVRVNGVAPGVVAWPEEGYESDDEARQSYLKRVPLARSGTPEDAAEAVRWLALHARYTTGQTVPVDGGRSLR